MNFRGFLREINASGGRLACLILFVATLGLYWPAKQFQFLYFDDDLYITENPHVVSGVTADGLKWAFTTQHAGNWHPLTWISHMLDCQIYGLNAGGHHFTNVLFHALNASLLFLLLARMTGRRGASFVVAALFAWHPAHVESVAWVAERKDVLSACFALLSLLAYAAYARRLGNKGGNAWFFYTLTLIAFALGLMAKSMLVTLPFVMLLLDNWPLKRFSIKPAQNNQHAAPWVRLLLEKTPFLMLSAAACALTTMAQKNSGFIVNSVPFGERLLNAAFSYWRYIGKIFWPADLAAFYPYIFHQMNGAAWLAIFSLIGVSCVALWLRRFPYIAVGWFWFLGTLVPVIGLVQVGFQSIADRYTYIPSIGLFVMIIFRVADLAPRLRLAKVILPVGSMLILLGCLMTTTAQVRYWRDGETLFRHAAAVTENNSAAYYNLGVALWHEGRLEDAVENFKLAIQLQPHNLEAHHFLGRTYQMLNQPGLARDEYEETLRLDPEDALTHLQLGKLYFDHGELSNAGEHFQAAEQDYREDLRQKPDSLKALNNLAWMLSTQPDARFRNGNEAVQLSLRARQLMEGQDASTLDTYAAALAECGRFDEAVKIAQKAAATAEKDGNKPLATEILQHLHCYEHNQPYREPRPTSIDGSGAH